MKKCTMYVLMLVVVSSFLFFYAGSCNNEVDYYVKFKANGEEVIFGLGFTDVEPNTFANVWHGDGDYTFFVATPETVDKGTTPSSIIVITIAGKGPGTYTYTSGPGSQLSISFRDSGIPYIIATGSVTVTSFGEVGGTIEGTFQATAYLLSAQGIKVAAPPDLTITEGSFIVKRIADDTYTPILIPN